MLTWKQNIERSSFRAVVAELIIESLDELIDYLAKN
jgi:hypothetical protein